MSDGDVEVVASEDRYPNIKSHLVDLHRLTDEINVQKEESVIKKSVGKDLMLHSKMLSEFKKTKSKAYPKD